MDERLVEVIETATVRSGDGQAERRTWSNLPLKGFYTPDDLAGVDYRREVGDVGEYPYTRGIHSSMYRGRHWTRRQTTGFGSAADTNQRLRYVLKTGVTALNTVLDQPTQIGIDADHPVASRDVGACGLSASSLRDIEALTDGLPIDQANWSWQTAPFCAPTVLAWVVAIAQRRGVDCASLRGTILNDPLTGHYCGCYPEGPAALGLASKLGTDITEYCAKQLPRYYSSYCDGYCIRELGITAVEEAAWCLADGIFHIERALERGLKVDDFLPRITFSCGAHIDFFEEIAKFRAMRRLWARITKERFGARDPRSQQFRFAAETSGSSLTSQQPMNNIVRITVELLAAVLGGVQAAVPACYDEGICIPTEEAQMMSIRTQQILAYETGATEVGDPLGGSYLVENLTNQLEAEITKMLERIEAGGGILRAIESGRFDEECQRSAARQRQMVENGERIVVGVNSFVTSEEGTPGAVFRASEESGRRQIAAVSALKANRDESQVRAALANLRERAVEGANLIPALVSAALAYATIGEMNGTMREAFGLPYDPFRRLENPFARGSEETL